MHVSPVLSVNTCRPGYEATHQVAQQNCITSPLEEGIHHLGNTIVQEIYIQKRWPHHQCKGSCDLWVTKGLATKFPRRTVSHCTSGGKGGGLPYMPLWCRLSQLCSHCHVEEDKDCYHRQERAGKAGSAGEVWGEGVCLCSDNQYADIWTVTQALAGNT